MIGVPNELAGKDKLYGIDAASGMFNQGSEAAPLPIPLDIHERRLPLHMGPDADDPRARFEIHIWCSGGNADTKVWVRINHTLLEPAHCDDHYRVEVPAGTMRVGRNELALFCDADLTTTASPIIVHDVMTSVAY